MPLISIIIPVYNGEKTIKETIESVLNQTFSDFELIVINDGSTDSTADIVSNISDPRLKIFSYPNANQAVSRNRGISLASGEYFAFLDADDLWTPDKLEKQLKALQENPQAAVVYSWTDMIDESSQVYRHGCHIAVTGNVYEKLLLTNFLENGSNPLIRRQAFIDVGEFDPSVTPAEDWDLYLRLAASYEFVAVPSPQILYRVSLNSSSANVLRLERGILLVLEKAFARTDKSLKHLKQYTLANRYKYLLFKVLDGNPTPQKTLIAFKFLRQAVKYDRALLTKPVILKVLFKSAAFGMLPPPLSQALITKFKRPFDTSTLLGYLKI